MSLTLAPDPAILGFQRAIREFKKDLKDEALYREILATTSVDQVYTLAEKIQEEQGKTGHLRHLSKIQKYLEKLNLYAGAIDTFVQVQPDILALIGLLIQWTSTLSKSQDAIANIATEIGDLLPEFTDMAALFSHNNRLSDVLCLFFQDILDFYLVTLRFFSLSRWRYFFESLWPKQKEKIELVKTHIERHAMMACCQIEV
ncbi:hypothetical protein NEMBOFW57_009044 [Staphylotrichum longicolle]|uniref:DUF7708 domain-containing protein n=1 Tax=Staphylotrichum longicolle TaxID=669026 RepID=A0AAD4EW83_9PEZI|nr:hypothetical protein NEMBOFW57_009044 [Staphylotrichum longicolle]